MEVLSSLAQEEIEKLIRSIEITSLLSFSSNLTKNTIKLVLSEQFWDPTRRKDIVDVDEELIVSDLTVSQDEENLSTLDTSLKVHALNISLEIVHTVIGGHNNTNDIITQDVRRQLGKRLLT